MSVAKLMLGTAGLGGLPYGREGRTVGPTEARAIIGMAHELGIRAFDTAPAYGFAESVLGEALRIHNLPALVFTKNNGCRDEALLSISRLKPIMPVFLWHNWDGKQDLPPWVKGATTYATTWSEPPTCRWLQVAWNVLRQVPPPTGAKIIARSVLLQGELADDETGRIPELVPFIKRVRYCAKECGMTTGEFCLLAALRQPCFEYVVVGPTSVKELETCVQIAVSDKEIPMDILSLFDLGVSPMTDPRQWTNK